MVLYIFLSLKSEFLILEFPCVINVCKAYLESPVWAWGKRSLVMQGQSSEFWSSTQCMCSATWNPVLCLIDLSACDNCILFNKVFICGSLRRMHCGRNITERFINRYFVTTVPCKGTVVAGLKNFEWLAQCWTKTKWRTLCFIWKGDWWYSCSVETSPRKISFLLAVCCVECKKCQLVRATKFQKLSPYKLVPKNDCLL